MAINTKEVQIVEKKSYQEVKESLLRSLRSGFIAAGIATKGAESKGYALAKEIKLNTLYQPVEIHKGDVVYTEQKKQLTFTLKSDFTTKENEKVAKDLVVKIPLSHAIDGNMLHANIFWGLGSFEERGHLALTLSQIFAPYIESDEGGKTAILQANSFIKNVSISTKNKDGEFYVNPETKRKVEYYDVILSQKGIDFINAQMNILREKKLVSRIVERLSEKK